MQLRRLGISLRASLTLSLVTPCSLNPNLSHSLDIILSLRPNHPRSLGTALNHPHPKALRRLGISLRANSIRTLGTARSLHLKKPQSLDTSPSLLSPLPSLDTSLSHHRSHPSLANLPHTLDTSPSLLSPRLSLGTSLKLSLRPSPSLGISLSQSLHPNPSPRITPYLSMPLSRSLPKLRLHRDSQRLANTARFCAGPMVRHGRSATGANLFRWDLLPPVRAAATVSSNVRRVIISLHLSSKFATAFDLFAVCTYHP